MAIEIPKFKELPLNSSHPKHSAWGLWGDTDELGCLNHLTPERIVAASQEVKSGTSVGLSWSMDQMRVPPSFRIKLRHEIFPITEYINDDVVEFNTQTSSQWDGFRHWSYPNGTFYNGVTQDEVRGSKSTRNGIQAWTKKGIVGRGVLIDFQSWATEHNIPYEPWSGYKISVSTMKEIAKARNIEFKPGDILLLRTGFINSYLSQPNDSLVKDMNKGEFHYPGLQPSLESMEWLWDSQFSAIASDNPGFEAWDSVIGGGDDEAGFQMHWYLLSGFGLPIGELFDLEALSAACQKANRWTFMFTSQPLNIPGGVGSPPNAVAIL